MKRTRRKVKGADDALHVREILESAKGFVGDVLRELDGADDLVPIVVEGLAALVADVGDWSNGVVHITNLVSGESALCVDAELNNCDNAEGNVGRSSQRREAHARTDLHLRNHGGG